MNKSERKNPPMNYGDVLKLRVIRFGKKGDPIMIHKGFVVFLKDFNKKGIELNRAIRVKIVKILEKFAFAIRAE